ncbi:MAG: DNA-directed RNA polymerase subunit alpha [Armatimonadetes bacterium]|nr:MAG: DNA-directed RNA polymerase subunit alpha [Armatimonadota bacterium]
MMSFKVTTSTQTEKEGTFVIEPLDSGFGQTLGNCLRRVMLSALEGTAIYSVKIQGASHQFSTIPGITEDVTEILLNLKKVRIKLFSNKAVTFRLQASGKGEIKAGDIDTLGNGEIVNPDQHIASLNSSSAKLNIELVVDKGQGYVIADDKKTAEVGVIMLDSIYTPVLSAIYKVEPTRVGRSTNYDKLTMDIITDGTITPEEALMSASKILSGYFKQIYEPVLIAEEAPEPTVQDDVLKMSVEELDLPVRITNALKAVEIGTVADLISTPRASLLKTKNLGAQSLTLISEKLSERGLVLSEA